MPASRIESSPAADPPDREFLELVKAFRNSPSLTDLAGVADANLALGRVVVRETAKAVHVANLPVELHRDVLMLMDDIEELRGRLARHMRGQA
ncbi:MAG: hypothetical protein J0H98_08240 [Solirubrobacterales bacterium]|nr:hypothetical protein [Solirubrobacterales bacterium]